MESAKTSLRDTVWRTRLMARNAFTMADTIATRRFHLRPHFAPVFLFFITYRCNLRCKTCGVCYLEEEVHSEPELTLDEWKRVVDSAVKLRTILIVISGGEPLLRPDVLLGISRYANDRGITIHVCSNGILIDRDYATKFAESGVNTISISLESADPDIHDDIRGKGNFERAINGIKLLREYAPSVRVGINNVITRQNFHNLSDLVPLAESLDVHQLKFAPIHTNLLHKRKSIAQYGSLLFEREDVEQLREEIEKVREAISRTNLLTTSPFFLARIADLYNNPPRFRCYAGYAAGAVDPIGTVAPCSDMSGVGCVRQQPLEEIWRSSQFMEARRDVRHCNSPCWDTANAELSVRLRLRSLIGDFFQTWKDLGFYFGKDER